MFQGGSLWSGLLTGTMSQIQDTKQLRQGGMAKNEYAVHTARNVTGALGVMAGVEYGAILGTTVMPGVGTVVGSVIGGLLGDKIGRTVGSQAGGILFRSPGANQMIGGTADGTKT